MQHHLNSLALTGQTIVRALDKAMGIEDVGIITLDPRAARQEVPGPIRECLDGTEGSSGFTYRYVIPTEPDAGPLRCLFTNGDGVDRIVAASLLRAMGLRGAPFGVPEPEEILGPRQARYGKLFDTATTLPRDREDLLDQLVIAAL